VCYRDWSSGVCSSDLSGQTIRSFSRQTLSTLSNWTTLQVGDGPRGSQMALEPRKPLRIVCPLDHATPRIRYRCDYPTRPKTQQRSEERRVGNETRAQS